MSKVRLKAIPLTISMLFCAFLSGCSGGGSSGGTSTTTSYTLGGTVTGMDTGTSIILNRSGTENLSISANGNFSFATQLVNGANYQVTISSNPSGQICSMSGPTFGVILSAAVNNIAVTCNPSSVTVSTWAGAGGAAGFVDGTGTAARFYSPTDIAVDAAGNGYVTDSMNRTIRKIAADGTVTTLAGTAGVVGAADGVGAAASFSLPTGIAVDASGNIYVSDTGNSTIRKITSSGTVTTLAGTSGVGGSADGTGAAATFRGPTGIATDSDGNVYVADGGNSTIRKITPSGVVTTLAGTSGIAGAADGTGAAASFYSPVGVAVDTSGNVYVGDGLGTVRKITPAGVVTTLAGTPGVSGGADGTGPQASFNSVGGVAVDASGNVYVADMGNDLIRKITSAGTVSVLAGTYGKAGTADGNGGAANFSAPASIEVDTAGNLYVADFNNNTIRKIIQ